MSSPPQICTYLTVSQILNLFLYISHLYSPTFKQYMRMNAIELERQRRLQADKSGNHNEHGDEGGH